MIKQWNVGIFLFNEVEVLDFAGPFEVFSITTISDQLENPACAEPLATAEAVVALMSSD